jgi:ketosteroid isomerase-like protein
MADYAADSVFITPQGVLEGEDAIRSLFEGLVAEFSSPDASVTIHRRHASGPVAYIIWSAETPANRYAMATDTLYVVDDRIRYQTFAAEVAAK